MIRRCATSKPTKIPIFSFLVHEVFVVVHRWMIVSRGCQCITNDPGDIVNI